MIWHVTDCIKYDLEVGCFVGLFKRWICWSRTVVTWSNCHGEAVGILVDISKVIQNNSSPTWFCQKKPRQQWPVNRWYSLYMYEEYCSNTYIPPDFSKFYFHSFLWGFIPASLVEVKDLKVVIQHCGWKRTTVIRYLFIEWEQLTHSNAKYENTPTQLFPSLLPLPPFASMIPSYLVLRGVWHSWSTSGLLTPKPKADVATTRVISSADQFIRTDVLSALLVSSPVYAAVLISVCWLKDVARSIADFLQSTYMIVGALPISAATCSSGCQ